MDLYGNDAYRMIFGFLMGSAIVGIIMAVLIRIRIKKSKLKNKLKIGEQNYED